MVTGASPEEMAAALAMYPMLKDGLVADAAEAVKLDGTADPHHDDVSSREIQQEQMAPEKKSAEAESRPSRLRRRRRSRRRPGPPRNQRPRRAEGPRDVHDGSDERALKVTTDVARG